MNNTKEAIELLEVKLKELLSKYEFLQEENKILFQDNSRLLHLVAEKEQQLVIKEQEYKLLKIAKTINGSSENTKDTKLKINALIREIDNCVKLLST
ncbi:hypothetical protein [Tenacibaculum sp. SG-28]|uniref:hypothetical protein n=1 Tax=Tenacibaculum sp. SG-28 TaxID=754426 RepID=UPI000CF51305|nr:hypothetical protein [Tenacibaculum sp. SG-28]PQJ19708.1 hypothetical protein BSU00_12145 [Tenacibaculum sp. SG-28]